MIWLGFLLAFIGYFVYATLSFSPAMKEVAWTPWAGVGCAMFANLIWMLISRRTPDPSILLTYAVYWDVMVVVVSFSVPILIFGARLSGPAWLGCGLIACGVALIKIYQ